MKLQVVICDDDWNQIQYIDKLVKTNISCDVYHCLNYNELNSYIESKRIVHILIVDICLGDIGGTGIDLVRKLHNPANVQVIYISGYMNDYIPEVYDTNHIYFIPKPISTNDMKKALIKACKNLSDDTAKLIIKNADRYNCLDYDDILFIESEGRKLKIVSRNETYFTNGKIKNIKSEMPWFFVHCHQSFLVNMKMISGWKKDAVILRHLPGESIPVSQRKRTETKDAYHQFCQKYGNTILNGI